MAMAAIPAGNKIFLRMSSHGNKNWQKETPFFRIKPKKRISFLLFIFQCNKF
jgi:hypothetical protein